MTDNEILAAARMPWGDQRFYPPGKHPATRRSHQMLTKLEALRERVADTPDLLAAIDYTERQIATFEMGEWRAKAEYLVHARAREQTA